MIKDAVLLSVVLVMKKRGCKVQFLHSLLQEKILLNDLPDNGSDFVVVKLRPIGPGHSHTDTGNISGGLGEGTDEDGQVWRGAET